MVKSGAIELIFKSHEPFQSYLLIGQANSAKKALEMVCGFSLTTVKEFHHECHTVILLD